MKRKRSDSGSSNSEPATQPHIHPDREPDAVQWTPEQLTALETVNEGRNLFICGKAGTGKSHLISEMLKGNTRRTAVTALTGAAATLLGDGATTLHSWAGIGYRNAEPSQLFAAQSENARRRWVETQLLIVDEVSMLSASLCAKLDEIGKLARKNHKPFGGIQVVFVGDFFQLAPVRGSFAFFSEAFLQVCASKTVFLTTVFRQNEEALTSLLDDLRVGRMTARAVSMLNALSCKGPIAGSTKLFPCNRDVDEVNITQIALLDARTERQYPSGDLGDVGNARFERLVALRINARVMCLRNLSRWLINGSVGTVVGFGRRADLLRDHVMSHLGDSAWKLSDNEEHPIVLWDASHTVCYMQRIVETVTDDDGVWLGRRYQYPLRLAWALTIHKAQGMSIELLEVSMRNMFADGHAYVGLSRATSLDGLRVTDFCARDGVKSSALVARFYQLVVAPEGRTLEGFKFKVSEMGRLIPEGFPPIVPAPTPVCAASAVSNADATTSH
ncbi:ATP-dependent DNA helicase PIF1 [Diplonema papillatum]|nr:ATP-dependent DNA helicase PIF1 [Diplonema papillatum]